MVVGCNQSLWACRREGAGWAARPGEHRPTTAPAQTFTGETHRWSRPLRSNNPTNTPVRLSDEYVGTLFFGHRGADEYTWVADAPSGMPD